MMNLRFTIYDLRLALHIGRRTKIFSNHQSSIINHQSAAMLVLSVVSE
jgi:hypothetical protein